MYFFRNFVLIYAVDNNLVVSNLEIRKTFFSKRIMIQFGCAKNILEIESSILAIAKERK